MDNLQEYIFSAASPGAPTPPSPADSTVQSVEEGIRRAERLLARDVLAGASRGSDRGASPGGPHMLLQHLLTQPWARCLLVLVADAAAPAAVDGVPLSVSATPHKRHLVCHSRSHPSPPHVRVSATCVVRLPLQAGRRKQILRGLATERAEQRGYASHREAKLQAPSPDAAAGAALATPGSSYPSSHGLTRPSASGGIAPAHRPPRPPAPTHGYSIGVAPRRCPQARVAGATERLPAR